jgi:hypothetical protein
MADTPVTSVPKIMRHHQWNNGARLLEIWLARPSATAPSYSMSVTHVIKMDWVLKFARAKEVYDNLVAGRIWANAAAQRDRQNVAESRPAGRLTSITSVWGPELAHATAGYGLRQSACSLASA